MTRKKHPDWCLGAAFCFLFGVFQGVSQVPYLSDFEGGIGPEWSLSNLETSATNSFTKFTGRFSNEAQTLTLTNLTSGQSYTIGFDLFIIDSWDGGGEPGGDFFNVGVYGAPIFHHTFNQFGGAQTYPGAPDVGPSPLGFGGFNDSIFRSIEVSFTATNATTAITFQGQNLQAVSDESWGIDNVQAHLTSALPPTLIQSTTLPAAASTNAVALDRFTITASRDLLASSATNATHYALREAGVNGTLGDGDDNLYALVPAFTGGKTASFIFNNSPLQPGNYRFETKTNLLDKNSLSVGVFTRQFVITNPIFGRIESASNDTLPTATPLPVTETPPASGFFTALGLGTFSAIGEVDYWRFDAEAGDYVTIRLEADAVGVYPQLNLQDASGQNQITAGGDFAGVVQIQNYRFNSPGTYYLRVFSNNGTARYQMRVDQARGLQLETEANDAQGTANVLNITASAGAYQAKVAGALVSSDAAGDYFRIGTLNPGNAISANLLLPGSSTLAVTNATLTVELQGNGVALATNTTGSLNYTVVSNSVHYVRIQTTNLNLRAQYILSINITDGVAPLITSLTFPSEGGVTSNIVDRVTLGFSEDVEAAFNGLSRRIWTFGTNAYLITDTAVNWSAAESQAQGLGGHLVSINSAAENTFIRDTFGGFGTLWTGFTDQAVEGAFAWISGEPVTFTSWNSGEPNNGGGGGNEDFASFLTSGLWNDADGGNNYRGVIEVAGTDSDGDGLPNTVDPYPADPLNAFDLRAAGVDNLFDTPDDQIYHFASYGYNGGLSASLRVVDGPLQPGNYRFTITPSLRDRAGNALSAPFVRLFTISGVSSFAVENRSNDTFGGATTLSQSPTNSSDGSFTGAGGAPAGTNPYFVLAGLLNADAHLDVITANNGSDNVSVLLGNGNGTFQPATNFTAGNGPIALALGTVNTDTNADLLVANNAGSSVSVLLGNGNGTFGTATNYTVGSSPRSVKLGDFNGDGKLDFVTANSGSANVSVALGNGDGSFGPRTNFAAASGPYGVATADFNADGRLDLAVANQSVDTVSVLLGTGNGSFGAATNFAVGNTPRSVAVGDLNGDGKPDVAVVNASDNQVSVLMGAGNGSFSPATNYPSGGSGSFHVVIADLDADGNPDVLVAGFGNHVVGVLRGNGNGTLRPVITFGMSSSPISVAAGDYNGDGRPDIATANYSSHNVGLLLGNNTEPLVEDPLASGIRTGTGRGNLNTSSDVDYWSFTGAVGDLFSLAVDVPGNPAASGLYYRIYRPDGAVLTEFGANYDGWGQSAVATLPLDGTYVVQVSVNSDYQEEYRLRVTTARPPTQMETENNNNTSQADVPSLVLTNGHQVAKVLGYISTGDGSGDYYLLGNLAEGTTITLGSSQPSSSGLAAILGIYDSSGVVVTNSTVRAANLTFTVPSGAGGSYYARVISDDFGVAQQFGGTNGFALRLDGANDYLGATDSASLRPTSLTLEGWFNFSAVGGTRVMMGKTLGGGANDSYVLWHDTGFLRAGIGDNGGFAELNFAWTPQLGAWYHLAYTFDNASDLHVLYINGVQQASGVVTRSPAFDTHPFLIGADINSESVNAFFAGKADEVRVWNAPRSGAQIAASMSQSLVGNESGLAGYWRFDEGIGSIASDAAVNGNNGTLFNNPVWAPSGLNNVQPAGLLSQYILNIDLADTLPPVITSNNLPLEGSTNAIVVDRFTLGFSEDMGAATVTNSASYDLRAAGPDTLFDTGDDEIYTVTSTGYATGLTGSYLVSDGPLQPGRYRFTARTTLQDRSGNGLASPHLRQFVLLGVTGFIFESRNNNTQSAATSLSLAPTNAPDGSFTTDGSFPVGTNPYFVLAGLLNGDANLDLVTANNGSDNVSVLLGNGDGTFQPATNFAAGNGPIALALGAVNNDSNADLMVVNNSANSVSVLLGNGNGRFGSATNFSVGSSPRSVKLGDFNGDGKLDFVTANSGSANVSVALGNADGSFGPRTNFAAASGPYGVATADFNADGKLDLAVANQSADNVSILLGNGNGSFGAATNFPVSNTPRSVAVGDLNGDGKPDVAVVNASDNQVSVLMGIGNGSFAPATNYPSGGSGSYHVVVANLDGDTNQDVVVAGYGNNVVGVLGGNGNGTLRPAANFGMASNPISVAAGDYNGDGRPDIATANYGSHNVGILLGNNTELLVEDPAGSGVRTGWARGNVSSTSDFDYWAFSADAGDLVTMAADVPGNPNGSGLYFRIDSIGGTFIGDFYTDFNGRGESQPFVLPFDGTYTVRVSYNYQYFGEYRFRLTLARPPMQIESEGNNTISQADVPALAVASGHQTATVLGYVSAVDPGDFFRLGNLAEGTLITLSVNRPASSGLLSILGIYNSSGSPVAFSAVRGSGVAFTVPPAAGGTYYARAFPDDFSVAQQFGGTNGSALRFDGGSAYMSAADSSSLRPANVTLEGWFNFAAVGGVRSLIGRTLGAADNNSYALWHDAGQLRGGVGDAAGFTLVNAAWSPQLDAWYHLAYVFDDAANAQRLYVNGALLASNAVTRTIGYDTHPVLVGADIANGNPTYFLAGKADEVRVWSVARTQAQIAADMNQSLVGNEAGLAGYWRFDEGTGTSAADATANANHGTLVNLPVWAPSGLANPQPTGLSAQYVVSIDLADTLPPAIVSNNLPAEGSTNAIIVDRFALGFSEDMEAGSVTNSGSYDLRAAGADNTFDTPDDAVYTVQCTGYTSGLSASYLVTDGPLQPGRYRFTATTALQDRLGNTLAAPHVRQFVLAHVAGFVFENRNNSSAPTATSLSTSPLANPDGSFTTGNNFPVGGNPYFVAAGLLNADANLDVVTANNGGDNVSVLLGNGDATFQPATNYATGNGPIAIALGDVNGDGKADIVVANNSANTVSVLPGNGNGSFQPATNYSVGTNPRSIKLGDLNGDGKLDIVAANQSSDNVSVLLGNGNGTFQTRVNYTAGDGPHGIAVADLNGDGRLDLVTANIGSDNLSLFPGNGDGTFGAAASLAAEQSPRSVAVGDLNGDGLPDIATVNAGNNTISVLFGTGGGSFASRVNYSTGGSDPYHIVLADMDADGALDVLVANYGSSRVTMFLNTGNGVLLPAANYAAGNRPIAIATGDFDSDGRVDVVTAAHAGNTASLLLNNDTELLAEDPTGSGVRSGFGRGNVFSTGDQDYWSFSGRAGDLLTVAADVPGNPNGSGLYYRIDRPDGVFLTDFYADQFGWGQSTPVTLPLDGTYTIRASYNYQYFGEYRLRVTLAPPPLQMESEDNNSLAQADPPAFTAVGGHQTATVLGYISAGDTSGDYYRLGTLVEGTTVGLSLSKPDGSGLVAVLGVYNSAGSAVATGAAGAANLAYAIPAAGDGIYYARVIASGGTAGLAAQYFLALDLADTRPTAITAVSLPPDGTLASSLIDRFTLSVNKDLDPAFNALNQDILLRNGHAYLLTAGVTTWAAAESQAQSVGGHLATLSGQAENDWVQQNFAAGGAVWIGLADEALEGAFVWASGEPVAYTNWNSGQPDNSGNQDYVDMLTNGKWDDASGSASNPGVIEVAGADSDADGLPNTVDAYPVDPLNVFELRCAGVDATFGTPDDQVYRLKTANYTTGLAVSFTVQDGPLQPGNYRFTVSTSLRDRFGNTLSAPFVRFFTVGGVPGYTVENRSNDLRTNATPLIAVEDPAGLKSAGGRGKLFFQFDSDYWSFNGNTGELFSLGVEVPGGTGNSSLTYRVDKPDGTLLTDFTSANNGAGQSALVVLPTNGTYTVRVTYNNNFLEEYRLRVSLAVSPLQLESEDNGAVALATPLTLATSGGTRSGSAAGYVRATGDLDYFSLGVITNGSTIFLSTRLPALSGLLPVVGIYNSANAFIGEAPGGRSDDGVAEVRITQTGVYYAVVRGGSGSGGLSEQYVLDAQVVPTGTVSFPNLQVVSLTPPSGSGILSGQPVNFSFTVQNVGSAITPTANWVDRVVISQNTIVGDADDHQLGVFPHAGALDSAQNYVVNQSGTLPDGISGPYYVIVQTDSGNAVSEFVLEGDNVTASSSTFNVNLAPYPDLKVENLAVTGPNASNVFSISWATANRGNLAANGGFKERLLVRNLTSGTTLTDVTRNVPADLGVNATLPQSTNVTATAPGSYQAQVTTDFENRFFEFDAVSHASAEQNTTATGFQILQYFNITLQSNPAGGGTVGGGGSLAANSTATTTAVPNTNTLPYQFVNWTENGVFQSASANFSVVVVRDRQLVANFTLPSFQITAANNPSAGGTVTGTGTYFYGSTNVLRALPNAGYLFSNWTENAAVVATTASLTNVVYSNRFVVANYVEANPFHDVTTATLPPGLAAVSGAGTYNNGQTATFTTPAAVTNPPNIYTLRRFTLNGVAVSTNASFNKTFSTADPTNVAVVAEYDTRTIVPQIVDAYGVVTNAAIGGYSVLTNPVAALPNYQLVLRFDRAMRLVPEPLIVLTNPAPATQPNVPTGGVWFTTSVSNDTYRTPAIVFTSQHNGTNEVRVSRAQDSFGSELAETNAFDVVVDAVAPAHPVLSLVSSNSSSATVGWSGYTAPADLGGFRVYLGTNNFSSLAGLTPLTAVGPGARSFLFSGLSLDRQYYVAVAAVDAAGNSASAITPLPILLASTIPAAVTPVVSIGGPNTALINWTYNSGPLLGFSGFRLYVEENSFTSVTGLTPKATLGPSARSAQVDALDRTKTYYIAVVGYNANNGFNPNVATATWSDPLSGTLAVNLTVGGAGQTVDIYQSVTISGNAVLTIQPGTTLRFAPGTGLTVQQGRLLANGTALDPIVLTSAQDVVGGSPAAGDWNGIVLANAAGSSSLQHVFVMYGRGLTLDGVAPAVVAFSALNNAPHGLNLLNGASLTTSEALLLYNDTGARQADTAQLVINSSVVKLNGTNAQAGGAGNLVATQNWWGTAVQADIASRVVGSVNFNSFLTSEPILTPAIGTVGGVTQVGSRNISLRFAGRTAVEMRASEDSSFFNVFFTPFTNRAPFTLSEGGGQKTIFAQFRSITGQTNPPVSVAVTYVTAGPVIQSFSLAEGQVVGRPVTVGGSATAALGMSAIELYVDNVLQNTVAGGNYSQRLDPREFSSGIRRVKLLARDTSGNIATLERNVAFVLTPPPAPIITVPAGNIAVTTNRINVNGTAEPSIEVRLTRNGSVVGTATADNAGGFVVNGVALVEGHNDLVAVAFDPVGSTSSGARSVLLDSGAPAALIMDAPLYQAGLGLGLSWRFPTTGERATRFQVHWHTAPFATASGASGHSVVLSASSYTLQALANGTYYFGVVGFDDAGNASPLSGLISFIYDAAPPALTVQFDRSSPVGTGPLRVTLTANEALGGTPALTVRPAGAPSPTLLNLTNNALNTYEGVFNVHAFTPSGPAQLSVSAQDVAGNTFAGTPGGAGLVIDVVPPAGAILTAPSGPVQSTNSMDVAVTLALTEAAKPGTTPTLSFLPPVGSSVSVPMSGSGSNWTGTLTVTALMGSGFGSFAMNARDAVDNVGSNITAGARLEVYNTTVPTPPATPANLRTETLAGGQIRLTWNPSTNAEIYRLYREPGTNNFAPTVLVADNLTNVITTNLPPADGSYRYAVAASRRGSESPNSNVAIGNSDRTPPSAPTNVLAQLAAAGIQISWQQPGGGEPPARFHVYRNGTLIRAVTTATPVIDGPPRGVMNYIVAAADAAGNESLSASASIELFVGAVKNLQALVNIGQAPALSWTSDDPTAVGFNVYRGGIRQNSSVLTTTDFVDLLPSGTAVVQYAVRAVNGAGQESAPRLVDVYAVDLRLSANPLAGNNPITRYFDEYRATVSNLTAGASLPLREVELRRTILGGEALVRTKTVNSMIGGGNWLDQSLVFPGAGIVAVQSVRARAVQETDLGGSLVIYQKIFDFPTVNLPANMVEIFANQLPLAGGLSAFEVRIFNRGGAPVDIVTTRNNGSQPGDIYVSVKNAQGQEVSRGEFSGTPPGTSFLGDGRGYVRVAPGASVLLTVPNVLVPDSLSSNALINFEAVVAKIYHRVGASDQEESGPLNGSMSSALAVTDYYGTAVTDRTGYANEQPVIITGQAVNRTTGLPVPNAALKIGFASGGYRWYREVTTDSGGNYQYTYNPGPGLGGTLTLWAAHPLIFDALNQARINIYRLYATPSRGDVRMSKNDTIRFSIGLLNPGDVVLSNFTALARAYVLSGTNRTEITNVTGSALLPADFALGFKQKRDVTLEMASAIDAPDNVIVEFTFTSGEGAVAVLTANVTLLQAIPVLTVISPAVGYLETSVDRGTLLSRQVTVVNRGLRDLQGVELAPPTNVTWVAANLPRGADGKIHLPDIGVGQSNTFTVVFAPPANTPLGPTNDFFAITGTNTPAVFKVNVYPLVTSSQKGAVQFYVDNILSQDVPNATVRLRNTQLQVELPPVYTDSAALVTVTNLQEGQWSWQVSAPGHSANVGVIDVIPGQTVRVDTRLNKSVVTINFTVVPVPYTDKYEIKLEQTFETHVPLPVLVMTPAYREFNNVTPGFEASYIVTAKNHGLIQMENLTITGQQTATASFTPLIDYVPVLLPQQEIEIPFKVVYWGTNAPSQQSNPLADCLPGIPDFGYIGDFVDGLRAIANAEGRCIKDNSLLAIAGGVALGMKIFGDITGLFAGVAEQVASYVGCVIGSLLANFGGFSGSGGGSGPGQGTAQGYGQGGPACFDPTTAVWMADGTQRPIGELRTGDSVRTGIGRNEVATVAQVFRRTAERLRSIRFEQHDGAGGILRSTDEHLFWVDGKGWTAANQLQVGDWLSTDTGGLATVSANETDYAPGEVVTLQLRGDNAFYANGILVHDMCGLLAPGMPAIMKETRP